MKTSSELKTPKKQKMASPTSTTSPTKSQSWLERLPVELIEQIFLEALEVNMAKASPYLGRDPAKESIYRMLILFAFFDDDGQGPTETKHFRPAVYRVLSLEEKLRLQKGILVTRWCTFGRIKQQLPVLARLRIVKEEPYARDREDEVKRALALQQQLQQQDLFARPSCHMSIPLNALHHYAAEGAIWMKKNNLTSIL